MGNNNTSANTVLGLRDVMNPKQSVQDYGKKLGSLFTLPWAFDKFYEKILLAGLVAWGIYSAYKIFWVGCPI